MQRNDDVYVKEGGQFRRAKFLCAYPAMHCVRIKLANTLWIAKEATVFPYREKYLEVHKAAIDALRARDKTKRESKAAIARALGMDYGTLLDIGKEAVRLGIPLP